MRVVAGINPDFADDDEIDLDALDALDEFDRGTLTLEELRHLIGPEAARSQAHRRYSDTDALFDDPEDY